MHSRTWLQVCSAFSLELGPQMMCKIGGSIVIKPWSPNNLVTLRSELIHITDVRHDDLKTDRADIVVIEIALVG